MPRISHFSFLIPILCIVFLLFACMQTVHSPFYLVRGSNLNIVIFQDASLGFVFENEYALLEPTVGNLNSSRNSLTLYEKSGTFTFFSNETFTLKITYTITEVKANGDQGNPRRLIESGRSININAGDTVTLTFFDEIVPYLPLMFIIGIIGILCIFGGATWGAKKMKEKEYIKGFTYGTMYIVIGVGLVLAWLWG